MLAEFIYKPTQLTEKLFTMKKSSISEKSSLATNNTWSRLPSRLSFCFLENYDCECD